MRSYTLLLSITLLGSASVAAWNYDDQSSWEGNCGSDLQSPIDVLTTQTEYWDGLRGLDLNTWPSCRVADFITNNIMLRTRFSEPYTCYGKIWMSWYGKKMYLQEIQFKSPSEHTYDGQHCDMEAQMVHYCTALTTTSTTVTTTTTTTYPITTYTGTTTTSTTVTTTTTSTATTTTTTTLTTSTSTTSTLKTTVTTISTTTPWYIVPTVTTTKTTTIITTTSTTTLPSGTCNVIIGVCLKVGANGGFNNDLLQRSLRFYDDEEKVNHYRNDHTVLNPYNTLMPSWSNAYYAYNGSYTFPPCSKDVQWILMKKPVDISFAQREAYRDLMNAVPNPAMKKSSATPFGVALPWNTALGVNNRDTQAISGRTVLEWPKPNFNPAIPEKDLTFKGSELQVKTISKSVSLSFVGCAVAALSVSVMFGYLLGSARRRSSSIQETDTELFAPIPQDPTV